MKLPGSDLLYFFGVHVIPLIRGQYGMGEDEAIRKFFNSETYAMLRDPATKLFRESPLVIFDMFKAEAETDDPRQSSYIQGDAYARAM